MTEQRVFNTLFLCTGNSARSQMAEALLNHMGKDRFRAYSAGSTPALSVQPLAIKLIADLGLNTSELRPKRWDEFAAPEAPQMDFIITVCDNVAGETCPVWAGHPALAHWGVPDPVTATGDESARRRAYTAAFATLRLRIELLLSLQLQSLDRLATQSNLREIGSVGA